MDRRKCKRIIKNVSGLLLAQLAEILEEEIGREKKLWVRKWLARRSTRLLSVAFKRTACRRSG
jgi:hypothetical protein